MQLAALARAIPPELQIMLADVGSAGGLHPRWGAIADHVSTVMFDPLDESVATSRDRYFPFALGAGSGEAVLNVTRRVSMTSLLEPARDLVARFWDKPEHMAVVERIPVQTRALDDLMQESGLQLDAIKIDVQGGEYAILEGARASLSGSVILAEVELSFIERYAGLTRFAQVVGFMEDCGFELIELSRIKRYRHRNAHNIVNPGLGMGRRAGRIAFCDGLFLRNDAELMARATAERDYAIKAMLLLLTYGKADMAARMFDAAEAVLDPAERQAFARYLRSLSGRHFGLKGLHRALDYFASKA